MSFASRDYQEKRDFIRMNVETPVIVNTETNETINGICHNLSGGGMLISLTETLNLGDKIVVTVSSHRENGPILKALTTVRRIDSGDYNSCTHGLEIEELIG